MAVLKRLKFAARSEAFNAEQKSLLEETIDADLAALQAEIEQASQPGEQTKGEKQQPKRQALPANLPRREIRHEPENTTCSCGCALEAHRRGRGREAGLRARRVHGRAPHPRQVGLRQVRDAGPGAGGAAHHRQGHPHRRPAGAGAGGQVRWITCRCTGRRRIFARAGLAIAALDAGAVGRRVRRAAAAAGRCAEGRAAARTACCTPTRRRWRCSSRATARRTGRTCGATARRSFNPIKAVVFDFADSRAGQHARDFLGLPERQTAGAASWSATTTAATRPASSMGVTEAGCLAHARRKFHELWANHEQHDRPSRR